MQIIICAFSGRGLNALEHEQLLLLATLPDLSWGLMASKTSLTSTTTVHAKTAVVLIVMWSTSRSSPFRALYRVLRQFQLVLSMNRSLSPSRGRESPAAVSFCIGNVVSRVAVRPIAYRKVKRIFPPDLLNTLFSSIAEQVLTAYMTARLTASISKH